MNLWRRIIDRLWEKRKVRPYAASPSAEQIANAGMILTFAGSPHWQAYDTYLCVLLGETMESAFNALRKGDQNAVLVLVSRAEAIYRLITEPLEAQSIIKKAAQINLTPTRSDS